MAELKFIEDREVEIGKEKVRRNYVEITIRNKPFTVFREDFVPLCHLIKDISADFYEFGGFQVSISNFGLYPGLGGADYSLVYYYRLLYAKLGSCEVLCINVLWENGVL